MEKAVLLISHGDYAKALLGSAEMIMGEQDNVKAIGLYPGDSPDELTKYANKFVSENEKCGKETIILVDLMGGTPYNASLKLLRDFNVTILTGLNLTMAIEALSMKDSIDLKELIKLISESAKDGIKVMNREILFK